MSSMDDPRFSRRLLLGATAAAVLTGEAFSLSALSGCGRPDDKTAPQPGKDDLYGEYAAAVLKQAATAWLLLPQIDVTGKINARQGGFEPDPGFQIAAQALMEVASLVLNNSEPPQIRDDKEVLLMKPEAIPHFERLLPMTHKARQAIDIAVQNTPGFEAELERMKTDKTSLLSNVKVQYADFRASSAVVDELAKKIEAARAPANQP